MLVSETEKILHLASQYLAMAGKSFIAHREDDSHTALLWDETESTLWCEPLNEEGLRLGLNVALYSLDLVHPLSGLEASYPLARARHLDILNWIERERTFCGLQNEYQFDPHYSLPYSDTLNDAFIFPKSSVAELEDFIRLRNTASQVLAEVSSSFRNEGEIRIWPHHFDTGLVVYPSDNKISSLGLGLAVPDEIEASHYFYLSAYDAEGKKHTQELMNLPVGYFDADKFVGAVLPVREGVASDAALSFFQEGLRQWNVL